MLTIAAEPTTRHVPVFLPCPPWCDQRDAHDPYAELDPRTGDLNPREHRKVLAEQVVPLWPQVGNGIVRVEIVRLDFGACDGTEPEAGPATVDVTLRRPFGTEPAAVTVQPDAAMAGILATTFASAATYLGAA